MYSENSKIVICLDSFLNKGLVAIRGFCCDLNVLIIFWAQIHKEDMHCCKLGIEQTFGFVGFLCNKIVGGMILYQSYLR